MNRHVRVIVVSYNSAAELPACLNAIAAQDGVQLEVVVVDNASTDRSVQLVRALGPGFALIENSRNLGFARANNLALVGNAPWFALVNPDATLPTRALAACIEVLEARPEVGMVGLRHRGVDGSDQPSAFPFLTLRGLLQEMVGAHRILPPACDPSVAQDVDWIQGSFMCVRGQVVRDVGGFDSSYFMYGEDLEWCWRIAHAGWKIAYLPAPVITHVGGASGRGVEPDLFVEHLKARVRFFQQHRGPAALVAARALIALSALGRWAVRELLPRGRDGQDRRPLFRAAMRWVLKGQPLSRRDPA